MSIVDRGRYRAGAPLPKEGVTLPDVFPSPVQEDGGRVELHDVLGGNVPVVKKGGKPAKAELLIAFGNGQNGDYVSPHVSETELERLRSSTTPMRRTLLIPIEVELTRDIERFTNIIDEKALAAPKLDGKTFSFPGEASGGALTEQVQAETARWFIGNAIMKGSDVPVPIDGIFFPTGGENGWVHLGENPVLEPKTSEIA